MKAIVYYMRPEFFVHGILGFNHLQAMEKMPDPTALDKTHVMLRDVEAKDFEDLFRKMQGEVWSPKGEARPLIRSKGLQHTSMSVGDVAVVEKEVFIVDNRGWRRLGKTA